MIKERWIRRLEKTGLPLEAMTYLQDMLDGYNYDAYEVLGVTIASRDYGQAYLFQIRPPFGDICYADYAYDILCWADKYYNKSRQETRKDYVRRQKAAMARREQEAKQGDH
jgi:hypothetical protein